MLYSFLRILVGFALKLAFRKIEISGIENIPSAKSPALLVSNHPIGFLEPLVIACNLPTDLWYLARGDFFKKALQRFLMNSIHILPIYRFRDGFSEMRKNESAIQHTLEKLKEGKKFLIFAEGSTKLQRSIRPIQKGTARIVAEAYETKILDSLPIIPIGFTITKTDRLRGDIFVHIGKPIDTKPFFEETNSIPRSIKTLTQSVYENLKTLVPQVQNEDQEFLLDQLIQFNEYDTHSIESLKGLSNKIKDSISIDQDLETLNQIDQILKPSYTTRQGIGSVIDNEYSSIGPLHLLIAFIIKLFGFIPYTLAKRFADANVNMPEFYVVILFVANILAFIVWIIVGGIIAFLIYGFTGLTIFVLVLIFISFNMSYLDGANAKIKRQNFEKLSKDKKQEIIALTNKISWFSNSSS